MLNETTFTSPFWPSVCIHCLIFSSISSLHTCISFIPSRHTNQYLSISIKYEIQNQVWSHKVFLSCKEQWKRKAGCSPSVKNEKGKKLDVPLCLKTYICMCLAVPEQSHSNSLLHFMTSFALFAYNKPLLLLVFSRNLSLDMHWWRPRSRVNHICKCLVRKSHNSSFFGKSWHKCRLKEYCINQ